METTIKAINAELERRAIPYINRPKVADKPAAKVAFTLLRKEMEQLIAHGEVLTRNGVKVTLKAKKAKPRKVEKAETRKADEQRGTDMRGANHATVKALEAELEALKRQVCVGGTDPNPLVGWERRNDGPRKGVFSVTRQVFSKDGMTARRVNGQYRYEVPSGVNANSSSLLRKVAAAFENAQAEKGLSVTVLDVRFMAWA